MPPRNLRIAFAASEDDIRVIDLISDYYGGIDRQSVLRIAVKLLFDKLQSQQRSAS